MAGATPLRVIIVKPSKYDVNGFVERFRWGFMPNSTTPYLRSLTPDHVGDTACETSVIDEYVETDLGYLSLLGRTRDRRTLLALVGVQSHQLHRALDLAAYASKHGVTACVIGGPHPMTCDTTSLQGRGISFALAEAERVWPAILEDAIAGELRPVYGQDERWTKQLNPPVLIPPSGRALRRYAVRMLGVYPARGCPYACNFCSVVKIAGHQVRSQPIEVTLATLRAAKAAGVGAIMFTSDNFNKYPEAATLLEAMIDERIRLPFFVQCDAQVYREPTLVALLARAGCFQMFVGVESFSREALHRAGKHQNQPAHYDDIVALCRYHRISSHFSNILGFPMDTSTVILDHLRRLRDLEPDLASFHILTPIPGTEQYDDFLAAGRITEQNLDRFDATCVTWRHPLLTPAELTDLLFRCYREFYTARDVGAKLLRLAVGWPDVRTCNTLVAVGGYSVQSRLGAFTGMHPMAGGIGQVRLDRAEDYLALRRDRFGLELVPLPKSLALPQPDREINRLARRAV